MDTNYRIFRKITDKNYLNDSLISENTWFEEIRIKGDSILTLYHSSEKFNDKKPKFNTMLVNGNPSFIDTENKKFVSIDLGSNIQNHQKINLTNTSEKKSIIGYECTKFLGHFENAKEIELILWKIPSINSYSINLKSDLIIDQNGISIQSISYLNMEIEGFKSKKEGVIEVINFIINDITDKDYDLKYIDYIK
jgi:hypothetical protein